MERTIEAVESAASKDTHWLRRWRLGKNRYDHVELAGAFGDVGTLIPFVVGYIAVMRIDPLGILFMFGLCKILAGLYYKTPVPLQPMKAIGGAAITSAGAFTPGMVCGAGLVTGIFWFLAGTTKLVNLATKVASKPITRGIVLGLGMSFIVQGVHMMTETPWLAVLGLVVAYALLTNSKFPAMFALLILAAGAAFVLDPALSEKVSSMRPQFRFPEFTFFRMSWKELVEGSLILALPQIPLTIGNGVIALRAENNELFPDRPVTDRMIATSTGLINLFSAPFGGIPMCHGAGGMAGHVRFGARTGGALVMLGIIIMALALFFSNSIGVIFEAFPKAILGVILFFAGAELAITTRDIGNKTEDVYVMLIVAGFAMWNIGAAFLVGIILYNLLQRKWLKL